MDDTVKVVNTNLQNGVGQITVSVPADQLSKLGLGGQGIAKGSWATNPNFGERYGLRPDSQTLTMPQSREESITLARDLYLKEPIVANVIDLMVDFCSTGMENSCEDASAQKYFDNLCKYADFDSLHRQIFWEFFVSGDVFILRGRKRSVKYGPDKGQIFFDYTVINPKFVTVEGPLVFGAEQIAITPNETIRNMVKSPAKYAALLRKLPLGLKQAALNNTAYYPPQELVSRISRKKPSYERYASPFLSRVFEPVLIKRRMREADLALTETVRNVLVTFTIGDKDAPANQPQLDALVELVENPSKSMELVWNHTLKVEYHYPSSDLFNDVKYNQVNSDILQGLGIPPVLIDGGGGTFATAWTSLLSVVERLEAVRDEVARWQESEYLRIAEAEGKKFTDIPSVNFNPLNLRDENVFKANLLELFDRGEISIETFLTLNEMDYKVEARRRQAEKKSGLDKIFEPREQAKPAAGRPSSQEKVDPGNYTKRNPQAPVDKAPPGKPGSRRMNPSKPAEKKKPSS